MLQNTRNVIVACSCAVAWLQPDLPMQMGLCADENDFAGSSLRWDAGCDCVEQFVSLGAAAPEPAPAGLPGQLFEIAPVPQVHSVLAKHRKRYFSLFQVHCVLVPIYF